MTRAWWWAKDIARVSHLSQSFVALKLKPCAYALLFV